MPESAGEQPTSSVADTTPPGGRDGRGRFAAGNSFQFPAGRSGNPSGRRPGASFAVALSQQAAAPVSGREEMARIARTIGLDPDQARNIDVVAALFYVVLSRMLVRATERTGRVDERLVGMLQVLLKALDPQEIRLSGPDGGPIPIAAAIASVQAALGMRPEADLAELDANFAELPIDPPESTPTPGDAPGIAATEPSRLPGSCTLL